MLYEQIEKDRENLLDTGELEELPETDDYGVESTAATDVEVVAVNKALDNHTTSEEIERDVREYLEENDRRIQLIQAPRATSKPK